MTASAGVCSYENRLAIESRCLLAVSGCVLDGADMAMAGGSRYAFAGGNPSSALAGLAGGLVGEGLCNLEWSFE